MHGSESPLYPDRPFRREMTETKILGEGVKRGIGHDGCAVRFVQRGKYKSRCIMRTRLPYFRVSKLTVRMDRQSESREAAASLLRLRSLIPIQLASQILVFFDRIVRYSLRRSSRASYTHGWFRWENGFDIFAVVSLQFTIDLNQS